MSLTKLWALMDGDLPGVAVSPSQKDPPPDRCGWAGQPPWNGGVCCAVTEGLQGREDSDSFRWKFEGPRCSHHSVYRERRCGSGHLEGAKKAKCSEFANAIIENL